MPDKCYTVTQAPRKLPDILHFVEEGHAVELTRHGKTVAVLVPVAEYRTMHPSQQGDFWQALQQFRQQHAPDLADIEEVFSDVRDPYPGRDVTF